MGGGGPANMIPSDRSLKILEFFEPAEELEGRLFRAPVGLRLGFDIVVLELGSWKSDDIRPASSLGERLSRSYSLCLLRRGGYRELLLCKRRAKGLSACERERRGRKDDFEAMLVRR